MEHQPLDHAPAATTFTHKELARLAAYRAAMRAGLYSDWTDEPPSDNRFTAAELARLTAADRRRPLQPTCGWDEPYTWGQQPSTYLAPRQIVRLTILRSKLRAGTLLATRRWKAGQAAEDIPGVEHTTAAND